MKDFFKGFSNGFVYVFFFGGLLFLALSVTGCALFEGQQGAVKDACPQVCEAIATVTDAQCKPMCHKVLSKIEKAPRLAYSVCEVSCEDLVVFGSVPCVTLCEKSVNCAFQAIDGQ